MVVVNLDEMPQLEESAAEKFRQTLALFDDGLAIQRLNLERRYPNESADEIEDRLVSWLAREGEG